MSNSPLGKVFRDAGAVAYRVEGYENALHRVRKGVVEPG